MIDFHTDDQPPPEMRFITGFQRAPWRCQLVGHKWGRWQRSGDQWWRDCTRENCDVAQVSV